MGALPRPRPYLVETPVPGDAAVQRRSAKLMPPKWAAVGALLVYCSVFWAIIWIAAVSGVDLVRAAIAAGAP